MDIVADANVIFSALIKEGVTAELLFNEDLHVFAPEFLLEEFSKHKDVILSKTKRTEQDFREIVGILEQIITFFPREGLELFLERASEISPDEDDVPYFALALRLGCPIWSNDKKIKEQGAIKVYSTHELVEILFRK